MVAAAPDGPELFWISGSPPAWRVLLGLALKQISYVSHRLDPSKGEHKSADYLLLNPRGQVPTLTFEGTVVRESIAILAFLDARWLERPLFGHAPRRVAAVWQSVIEAEVALHAQLRIAARILFRGESKNRKDDLISAIVATREELDHWEKVLALSPFAVDEDPSAADCVLYPSIAWLHRAIEKSAHVGDLPANVTRLIEDYPMIASWRRRIEALPGFETTIRRIGAKVTHSKSRLEALSRASRREFPDAMCGYL